VRKIFILCKTNMASTICGVLRQTCSIFPNVLQREVNLVVRWVCRTLAAFDCSHVLSVSFLCHVRTFCTRANFSILTVDNSFFLQIAYILSLHHSRSLTGLVLCVMFSRQDAIPQKTSPSQSVVLDHTPRRARPLSPPIVSIAAFLMLKAFVFGYR